MPLLAEQLSIWEIGFRWAGKDPDQIWLRLPLHVKDHFRLLMEAVLSGEILCETLTLAKRPPNSKADPAYYIRTYIDDVYACIHGQAYNRKLLRWAEIGRSEFRGWCEAMSIPLPEFWFPPGWKYQFEMPEGGTPALCAEHVEPKEGSLAHISYRNYPGHAKSNHTTGHTGEPLSLKQNQATRISCQQIASKIWKEDSSRTIASVVEDELIQKYGGGSHYQGDTVRKWIREVAPPEVRSRRGRPKKHPSTQPDTTD